MRYRYVVGGTSRFALFNACQFTSAGWKKPDGEPSAQAQFRQCSLVALKPAHSPRLLPVKSGINKCSLQQGLNKSYCGGRKDAELYGTGHHLLSQAKGLD